MSFIEIIFIIVGVLAILAGAYVYSIRTGKIKDDNNNYIPDSVDTKVEAVKETVEDVKVVVKEVKRRAKRVQEELKDVKEGAENLAAQVEDVIDAAAGKPKRGRPRKSPSTKTNKK